MKKRTRLAIVFLCIVGALLSAVSLKNHYSTTLTGYCDLDEIFNCDLVNRSIYSRVLGVPVALIGLVGYVLLGVSSFVRKTWLAKLRLIGACFGLAFALYLAYIEARILAVWCLLCIGSLLCIATIAVLAVKALREAASGEAGPART